MAMALPNLTSSGWFFFPSFPSYVCCWCVHVCVCVFVFVASIKFHFIMAHKPNNKSFLALYPSIFRLNFNDDFYLKQLSHIR